MLHSFIQFVIDCSNPRTQYGQGALFAAALGLVLEGVRMVRGRA